MAVEETFPLFHVGSQTAKPITVDVEIEGQTVQMEVDTGAAVSLITEQQQQSCFHQSSCTPAA